MVVCWSSNWRIVVIVQLAKWYWSHQNEGAYKQAERSLSFVKGCRAALSTTVRAYWCYHCLNVVVVCTNGSNGVWKKRSSLSVWRYFLGVEPLPLLPHDSPSSFSVAPGGSEEEKRLGKGRGWKNSNTRSMGRKEAAAELGIRGVRNSRGSAWKTRGCLGEEGREDSSKEGWFKIKLASSRENAPAITELFFTL